MSLDQIIGPFGGYTIALIAVLGFIAKILQDAAIAALKAKHDTDLQELRDSNARELAALQADWSDQRESLSSILKISASGYAAPHPRIIESVTEFWKIVLTMRRQIDPHLYPYAMLYPDRTYDLSNETTRKMFVRDGLLGLFEHSSSNETIEDMRPMIGERFWYLYQLHNTFCHHMMWKIVHFRRNGLLQSWDKDEEDRLEAIADVLRDTISEADIKAEAAFFMIPKMFQDLGQPQRILRAIETKMLAEINEWIFGRKMVDLSVGAQSKLMEVQASLAKSRDEAQIETG